MRVMFVFACDRIVPECTKEIYEDNIHWIEEAAKNDLVWTRRHIYATLHRPTYAHKRRIDMGSYYIEPSSRFKYATFN